MACIGMQANMQMPQVYTLGHAMCVLATRLQPGIKAKLVEVAAELEQVTAFGVL